MKILKQFEKILTQEIFFFEQSLIKKKKQNRGLNYPR